MLRDGSFASPAQDERRKAGAERSKSGAGSDRLCTWLRDAERGAVFRGRADDVAVVRSACNRRRVNSRASWGKDHIQQLP